MGHKKAVRLLLATSLLSIALLSQGAASSAAILPGRMLDIEPGLPVHAGLAQGSLALLGSLASSCSLAPFVAPMGEPLCAVYTSTHRTVGLEENQQAP